MTRAVILCGGSQVIFEREPLQGLAQDGELGFWQPMDTLREFNLLNELWTS